jgi:outer membrane protein assembly factor BamA
MVRELNLRGVREIDASALRARLATRETPRFPLQRPSWLRWWRWWWVEPEYFDEASLARDRLRILRFYQDRGFYDAQVAPPTRRDDGRHTSLDVQITEGEPVRVADVRLRGCEEADTTRLPDRVCRTITDRLNLLPGSRFDASLFDRDRDLVLDYVRDAGFAAAVVVPRAVVDPGQHRAWLEYTVRPGSRSRFGRVELFVPPREQPITSGTLPNGLPVGPVLSALGITPGSPYSRRRLADAQQSLFDLGVFGIARIEENPRADGDVDLRVQLSTARLWRMRLGGGFESDNTRNNIHLLFGYEHRNAFGGFRRARFEARPQLFFSSLFNRPDDTPVQLTPGVSAVAELAQPELFRHTTGIVNAAYDYGPDPINPAVAFRNAVRVGLGAERRFSPRLSGSAFVRFTRTVFSPNALSSTDATGEALGNDPLYRQQYANQFYAHLEQTLNWDRRNSRTRPTRGWFVSANLAESVRNPLSEYTFVRGAVDGRAYYTLSRNTVLAVRGNVGLALGSSRFQDGRWYWPVPPELRFFSGGSQSNRGYNFNRVGALGTIAEATPDAQGALVGQDVGARVIALGGTAMWEASAELRWQPGNFGLVAFFDMSNVVGVDPTPFAQATAASDCGAQTATGPVDSRCAARPLPSLPPPQGLLDQLWSNGTSPLLARPHPSIGLGLRYLTPVGPLRLDVGVRLDDLLCRRTDAERVVQNNTVNSRVPAYYVFTTPRCDFLTFDSIPATLHISIGEAY